jgi:hypothetical protein
MYDLTWLFAIIIPFVVVNYLWWILCFIKPIYIFLDKPDSKFGGIALAPFILYYRKEAFNLQFKKHEECHVRQYRKYTPLLFLLSYSVEFLFNFFKYKFDTHEAYINISYEIEARKAEEEN